MTISDIIEEMFELLKLVNINLSNLSSITAALGGLGGNISFLFGALGTIAVSLYGLSLGRTRAVMSLLAIYAAFTLDKTFPYFDKIQAITGNSIEPHWSRMSLFFLAYAVTFAIFNFSFIKKRLSAAEFSLFGIVLISLLQLGFLVSIIFSFLPEMLLSEWSFNFPRYFNTQQALFLWAVAPLPVLFFLKSR